MCGIAGSALCERPASPALLRKMCDQIVHRGPDDAGYHLDAGCAIGMRRLSIIDLNTGHQPISNEDQTIWVVFNGEIYNYQALRSNLIGQGHRFTTQTDTEVLAHLYEQEGVAGIARLRGMFAYALWDARKRQLLLARDRFGKKPLYYSIQPEGLYFGSELKCLRAAGIPLDLDREAIRRYLQFFYIPDPHSPFLHVKKLEPGSWMTYSLDGVLRKGRYWTLPAPAEKPEQGVSEAISKRQLIEKFDESVRLRMIADVPLGAFLSGGVDSSAVVASMALQSSEPVKTFSVGFEESIYNELSYASLIAKKYNTDHHEILLKPDSISLTSRLVDHFDEPFGDSSAIPTFLVSEFAARHVKVVLTGDGGDELFAGYDSFLAIERLRYLDHLPQLMRRGLSWVADRLPYSMYGKSYLRMISRTSPFERYFERNYSSHYLSQHLLRPEWLALDDTMSWQRMYGDYLLPNGADALSQAWYFEITAKLTGDMLVKVDRMSMANSLEVRSPLLDHELAELAARIRHSWIKGGLGKACLIEAMGDRLPPETWNRPKRGFSVPIAEWFRGPLREFLWDHLNGKLFLQRGFVSPPFMRHLLEEHDSGRRNNRTWLWGLLMLELWCRKWQDVPTPDAVAVLT